MSRRARGPGPLRRLQAWGRSHAQQCVAALGRMAGQPLGSALTVAVLAIALALPAGLQLLVTNARDLSGGWQSALDFSVYLAPETPLADAEALTEALRTDPRFDDVTLVPADAALEEFRSLSGFGEALEVLEDNPLPHALVVRPAAGLDAAAIETLADELAARDGVERVQLDTAWVQRFQAILDIVRRLTALVSALLAVAVIVIIGNTIRLDIQHRRGEIEVMKLIGGSDAFIRRPFLYGGLWYGLAGGFVSLALILVALAALGPPVSRLAGLYGADYTLAGPGAAGAAILVGGGAVLGWAGAWVATARHLRAIEPA